MSESQNTPAAEPGHTEFSSNDTHDENGVDLTLVDEMLSLEPIERLRLNNRAINAIQFKRGSTHPKDRHVLPILEAAQNRKRE